MNTTLQKLRLCLFIMHHWATRPGPRDRRTLELMTNWRRPNGNLEKYMLIERVNGRDPLFIHVSASSRQQGDRLNGGNNRDHNAWIEGKDFIVFGWLDHTDRGLTVVKTVSPEWARIQQDFTRDSVTENDLGTYSFTHNGSFLDYPLPVD